ncbi:glutamate-1-semialdehyde 2,1-aminomutase [Planctomicrobium sp. SH527]|uniref:glutamate-1-semialdehyde 2,1-aminomutase n=1 Tax=Planctomicrobium sp. SH527 TaxID=3448123 RepID=UPI003F5CA162
MLNHSRSQAAFERASKVIPGGVNSPARAFGGVGGSPVFIARGQGPHLYDIDGNRYLDFVGSWGPHILGHRHPAVIEAVQRALETGTSFGAPTEIETDLAELVIKSIPSIEKIRMVSSGTEATMSALRVARGFTGRDKIIKFAGCYHGHVDSLLVQAGSGALTLGSPSSPGVPAGCTKDTLSLEYNDVDELTAAFKQHGDELAALILEPVVGNMGTVLPTPEFLKACRDLCTQYGTVLIFDEVMTGFRVAFGGAQERFGITPDLTTLGKIIGGGMPVGAYGGRADIMNSVSPVGPVYQAGTLSGNPLAMACGLATLNVLKATNPYPKLEQQGAVLCDGLSSICQKYGIPHSVPRAGGMFTLFFNPEPVTSYRVSAKNDTARFSKYFHGMLERGVYLPCSQFEANFLSATHTDEDIQFTLNAADSVLSEIASA